MGTKKSVIAAAAEASAKVAASAEAGPTGPAPRIVEATGSTVLDIRSGDIERAMGQAILDAEVEAKAIWENTDLDIEERRRLIAALMDPEALKVRKLKARQDFKAAKAQEAAQAAATKE